MSIPSIQFSPSEQATLGLLAKSQKKTLFKITKNGTFAPLTPKEHIAYFFNPRLRHQTRHEIKLAVEGLVSKVNLQIQEETDANRKTALIQKVVLKALAPLSEKIFERKQLKPEIISMLRIEARQQIDLNRKAEWKNKDPAFDEIYTEAKLSELLGMTLTKNKQGTTGSLIIRNFEGKKIAIFKPRDSLLTRIVRAINTFIYKHLLRKKHRSYNFTLLAESYKNEVAARVIDLQLGLKIVPPTGFAHLKDHKGVGRLGSLQKLVSVEQGEELRTAAEVFGVKAPFLSLRCIRILQKNGFNQTITGNQELLLQFQKMAILDFILANLDRHIGNWLVQQKTGAKGLQSDAQFHAIDHGLSGTKISPFRGWNQNQWAYMSAAKTAFTPEIYALVQQINPHSLLEKLKEDGVIDKEGPQVEIQDRAIGNRILLLKELAKGPNFSPRHISEYGSDRAIANFLFWNKK